MADELWSISGTADDADAGEISGDFSPINHRPLAITHCQVKEIFPDSLSLRSVAAGFERVPTTRLGCPPKTTRPFRLAIFGFGGEKCPGGRSWGHPWPLTLIAADDQAESDRTDE